MIEKIKNTESAQLCSDVFHFWRIRDFEFVFFLKIAMLK